MEGIAAAEAKKTPIKTSRSQRICRLAMFFLLKPFRYLEKITRSAENLSRKGQIPFIKDQKDPRDLKDKGTIYPVRARPCCP